MHTGLLFLSEEFNLKGTIFAILAHVYPGFSVAVSSSLFLPECERIRDQSRQNSTQFPVDKDKDNYEIVHIESHVASAQP